MGVHYEQERDHLYLTEKINYRETTKSDFKLVTRSLFPSIQTQRNKNQM